MQFNSYAFILFFLPLSAFGLQIVRRRNVTGFKVLSVALSVAFYGLGGGIFSLTIFILSMIVNVISDICLDKCKHKKLVFYTAILFHIFLLFYFKYYNFAVESFHFLLGCSLKEKVMDSPPGISFITFQQIAWLAKRYKGMTGKCSVWDYLAFITFFPKILMGPLAEPEDMIRQYQLPVPKTDYKKITAGIQMFSLGLVKKVLLADKLGNVVKWGFENIRMISSVDILVVILCCSFQIYFDFSGYCDMASGVGKLCGIDLPVNFNSPYKAVSVTDFWKRWHMTLTAFLKAYIYIPLGGNRRGNRKTYRNILIVYLVSGIWHGPAVTYILWGILHGFLSILDRMTGHLQSRIPKVLRWMGTFFSVSVLWLLFQSDHVNTWLFMLRKMLSFQQMSLNPDLAASFQMDGLSWISNQISLQYAPVIQTGLILFICFTICIYFSNNQEKEYRNTFGTAFITAAAVLIGLLNLSTGTVFVYHQF